VEANLRLRKRESFARVFRHGQSTANRNFVLYYRKNATVPAFRLGVSVSKKVGCAVIRNRIRRLVKEVVRLQKHRMKSNFDLILIAKKPAADLDFWECKKNVLHILNKAQILAAEKPV
jgi:ribonuclease P protein component